jgi:hypothetical protein
MILHAMVDPAMPQVQDQSVWLERTFLAAAQAQHDRDFHQQTLFRDESLRRAARHEAEGRRNSESRLAFRQYAKDPAESLIDAIERDAQSKSGEIAQLLGQPWLNQPPLKVARPANADRDLEATAAFQPSPALLRMIVADAKRPTYKDLTSLPVDVRGIEDQFVSDGEILSRSVISGSVPRLAHKYTEPFHRESDTFAQNNLLLPRPGANQNVLADPMSATSLYSQSETSAGDLESLIDPSWGRGPNPRWQSIQRARPEAENDGWISTVMACDPTLGASTLDRLHRGFGDLIDPHEEQAYASILPMSVEPNDEWKSGESLISKSATNAIGQEAIAAVADELERLRAAVRETVDELDRARGSVQPSLPALPVNRGAFRVS